MNINELQNRITELEKEIPHMNNRHRKYMMKIKVEE